MFGTSLYSPVQSAGTQWTLGIVDAVVALRVWAWPSRCGRGVRTHPALEPAVLQRAYYLDDIYDAVIGRPGQAFARFCATVIDNKVIDGAVNGVGRLARAVGGGLRRVQTGFVRQYALGIVLGAAVAAGLDDLEGGVMTHDTAFPFLTVLVLLPAGAALAAALVPASLGERGPRGRSYTVGMGGSLATLALAVTIAVRYQAGNGGYRLVSQHVWASSLGISWHLGVDGISVFLVLMAAILFPLAMAGKVPSRPRSFVAWMLLLEAGCLGSFVSLDLILFFLFFELTLVPVYFVIAGWGFSRRGPTRRSSSSYTRSWAPRSCWWGSWPWPSSTSARRAISPSTWSRSARPTWAWPPRCCCSWPSPPPSP